MWDLLSPQDFVTSCIGHLENNGSLSYVNMPNVDVFVYDIKKITFVNISTDLIKIVFNSWEPAVANGDGYTFSKTLIFVWKIKCYHWQQILSVVFCEITGYVHFQKMSAKYPHLSVSHSSKYNGIPWKQTSSAPNSNNCTVLFLKTTILLWNVEVLLAYFSFHHTEYEKRHIFKGFYCFIKNILNWNRGVAVKHYLDAC